MIEVSLNNLLDQIKAYLASGVFPGASFALVQGNAVRKYVMGNERTKPQPMPLKAGMAYDLASVSKVVGTGTVVIDLILSGELALDDRLITHYPEFKGVGASEVTIRQLLTHTSGVDPFIENRNRLDYAALRAALNRVTITSDKSFHYSDVNFILLGFMLEAIYGQDLADVIQMRVLTPFKMSQTGFVAPAHTVPTAWDLPKGQVHDPKARVLGRHTGSAGLFSDLDDLVAFSQAYFSDEKYLALLEDYGQADKPRSLAWDLLATGDGQHWLLHTGYTGTFLMLNLHTQQAVVFLSNRVHLQDNRAQWLLDRDLLIQAFVEVMKDTENL
ncbi:MAG: beta-lactamase family protein [Streptococcaceae bacterium]|jgi:CubicO group peptidase (beta-lactamase class C family)|nr:beta-lactamase family protein [Streptococcaceae bacterium]